MALTQAQSQLTIQNLERSFNQLTVIKGNNCRNRKIFINIFIRR